MEDRDVPFAERPPGFDCRFDALPPRARAIAFGVPYARVACPGGHELFLTRDGWRWREHLLPARWYDCGGFAARGTRLTRSTGTVYRLSTEAGGRTLRTVVKISRVAQHLEEDHMLPLPEPYSFAMFASPFEEFAAVERLRRSRGGPLIRTKRPLAILCSAKPYRGWQLGREAGTFRWHAGRLERDQRERGAERPIRLEPDRDYLVVFQWIEGLTLLDLRARGLVDDDGIRAITLRVSEELEEHGLRVLDHKPDHVIVRPRPDGSLPVRRGRLVYALADYELLVPVAGAA